VRAGDTVWIALLERHCHGAARDIPRAERVALSDCWHIPHLQVHDQFPAEFPSISRLNSNKQILRPTRSAGKRPAHPEGVHMKPLSEQLTDLAARAKKSEDFVTAARAKNRAYLDGERESLQKSITIGKERMSADAAVAQDKTRSWWNDARQSIDARVGELRSERDNLRAAHDLKKAERRADDAEDDAAYAVDFALQMLDEAEYAVTDAILARIDADELAAAESA
jgi:hypothetical protein